MKKASVLLVMIAALLFNNSFAQVTTKGGTNTTKGETSTTTPVKGDKGSKQDQVKSEVSKDAATTAKEWTAKMDEICNLDATQEKKVMEINLKYANKLEELKAKYQGMDNPSAENAKSEKDELTKQRLGEYNQVLSKEQMQKFKEYRQSQKDENKGNSSGDKAEKKQEMKDQYKNATPEEKEKMKEEMKNKKDSKSGN